MRLGDLKEGLRKFEKFCEVHTVPTYCEVVKKVPLQTFDGNLLVNPQQGSNSAVEKYDLTQTQHIPKGVRHGGLKHEFSLIKTRSVRNMI